MAEEKKDKKKEGGTVFTKSHRDETFVMVGVLLVLGAIAQRLFLYFNNTDLIGAPSLWESFLLWLQAFWPTWKIISAVLTGAAISWWIYSFMRLKEVEEMEKKIFGSLPEASFAPAEEKKDKQAEKWEKIVKHSYSDSPSDWRLAIIEADIMLEDALKGKGLTGEGIGEMLKSVDPSDMLTLDNAWEAHKVRNRIAHSGTDFELNERETRRVITLFESVFKEFQII
jgi:hypothetical protein